jgi:predicted dehydrogenase
MALKVCIIGTGIMGSAVAHVLAREPRARLVAACNLTDEPLQALRAQYGIECYRDYVKMLDKECPEVVFIATPDWAHFEPVMACLSRGIHVFVEKPLTTDVAEARAIVDKVAETGLKLQISYNHRWLAPYHLTWKKIQAGDIGRPLVGYARKNNPITVPTKMLASWAKDSSPMWFQSSHDIDLMLWWFDDVPVEVTCTGVKSVLKAKYGWDTWDALQGQVRFKNGGMATFEAAWVYPEGHPSMPDSFMSIVGEHGHLQIDRKDEAVEMSHPGGFTWPRSLLNFQIFDRWGGAFPACITSFFDVIEEDRTPYVNATDGWRVTAVLDALHRAADNGEVVKLEGL